VGGLAKDGIAQHRMKMMDARTRQWEPILACSSLNSTGDLFCGSEHRTSIEHVLAPLARASLTRLLDHLLQLDELIAGCARPLILQRPNNSRQSTWT